MNDQIIMKLIWGLHRSPWDSWIQGKCTGGTPFESALYTLLISISCGTLLKVEQHDYHKPRSLNSRPLRYPHPLVFFLWKPLLVGFATNFYWGLFQKCQMQFWEANNLRTFRRCIKARARSAFTTPKRLVTSIYKNLSPSSALSLHHYFKCSRVLQVCRRITENPSFSCIGGLELVFSSHL